MEWVGGEFTRDRRFIPETIQVIKRRILPVIPKRNNATLLRLNFLDKHRFLCFNFYVTPKFKEYSQASDKFFPLSNNPDTKTLNLDVLNSFLNENRTIDHDSSGVTSPPDPEKPVSVDPTAPKIENSTDSIPISAVPRVRARVNADPDGDSMSDNTENAQYSGSTEGYEHALRAFYPFAFRFLSRKFNRDMEISDSETTELTDATLPLMRKYIGRDFRYGEEVRFALTIAGIWSKKLSESDSKPYPKGVEMEEKPETHDKKTVEERKKIITMAGPILDKFAEMGIEYDDLEPVELDDLHYQKLKKFIEKSGQGIEIDRENAGKIAAVFKTMGLDPANVIDHFENLPPELLSNFIRTQI